MSHLAEMVATGPYVFNATPTEKTQDVIYVRRVGMLEWFDASDNESAGYRSPIQDERIGFFLRRTAPRGWLKANGAAVLVAAYVDLTTDIYCGDENNANAEWGYRCTSPAAPSTTRSITGAYMVLPDLRGEFVRGWDDARGVDFGRLLGSSQLDAFQGHAHEGLRTSYWNNGIPLGGNPMSSTPGTGDGRPIGQGSNGTPRTANETRPRNVALLACIKI